MAKTLKRPRSTDLLTIQQFIRTGRELRAGFIGALLSTVSSVGISVLIPYYIGSILAALTKPAGVPNSLLYGLVIVCGVTLLFNRITFTLYLSWVPKVMARLQERAFDALLRRGVGFHNNHIGGKLVSDAIDYPRAFSQLSSVIIIDILPFTLTFILGVILVGVRSPLLGLVLFLMTVLAVGTALHFRYRMQPFRTRRLAATKAVTSHVADTIVNHQTVKTFGNEKYEVSRHHGLGDTLLQSQLHDWGAVAKDGTYRLGGLFVFEIIFVVIVSHQVHLHPELLATGIFAFSYTITISNRLFQIGTMMRSVEEALLQASPMTEMLQESDEIKDAPGAGTLQVSRGAVDFCNVSFRYQDNPGHDAIFKDLELRIAGGEKVGLVGPSGGGKTTLTKLLLRFEDITAGHIDIDSQDIAGTTQHSLRGRIAYVAQEPLLFHRSIRENIAYAHPEATGADIVAAAHKAYADEFIQSLPAGYDTVVGERGVKLSGGQRQRIAIARAILKDAPILVLDEATSALDSASEHAIQKALTELMQDKTAIVIAHRLSTIQRLDRIIVLDNGKIIEQGNHKTLLANKGLYARLWKHQSGGFIEE